MRVILTLSGLTSPEGRQKVAEIGAAPFRVGRSPEADWTLEDPTNQISRVHFELRAEAGGLVVTDLSSRGTALDQPGARLQTGQPAPLGERSRLILPNGEIEVAVDRTARAAPPPPVPPASPFARNPVAPPPPQPAPAPGRPAPRAPETAEIQDVFGIRARAAQPTPFAPAPPPPSSSSSPPRRATAPPLPSLSGQTGSGGRPVLGAAPGGLGGPASAPARAAPSFDDVLRGGGRAATPPPPAAPPAAPPAEAAAAPPPFLAAPPAAGAPAAPASVQPPPPQTQAHQAPAVPDGVAEALFAAMGIDTARMTAEEQAALAGEIGRSFRALALGMRRLLDGRRAVKRELGIAGTEIAVGANPLKVLPDPQAAAEALVRPPLPGFLSGEAAVEDAVAAMLHHQMALVGGIRSAIRIALAAFDPAEIEQRLAARGLSQVVPALRRAELWERFCETYAQFAGQADDDIRKVIGSELEKLYSRD